MSQLLLDEQLLCYQPELVRRLGLAEAAIVQQLHYWTKRSTNVHDGERWVYKTYDNWSEEIGLSARAVRGALERLRRAGVVVAMQSPLDARDRTLWWRIDRQVLEGPTSSSPPAAPSAPDGSPSADCPEEASASARTGSSMRARPDAGQRLRSETTNAAKARDPRLLPPQGFPDELRPHAREVLRVLQAVAADHSSCKAVWPREVGLVVMAFPRRPLVATVHELAVWAVDPPRVIKDAASSYRTFLKKTRDLGAIERLEADGTPACGPAGHPPGVTPIRRDKAADREERHARRREAFLRSQEGQHA